MWYFIGLGNPGKEYENTRHNIGMITLVNFFKQEGVFEKESDSFFQSIVYKTQINNNPVLGLLPQTYMNASGIVARQILKRGGVPFSIVVIHDDIDLPFGEIRVSFNRGAGGHNGVSSIHDSLGTGEYTRIRIGIAHIDEFGITRKPESHSAVERYVLGNFTPSEQKIIEDQISKKVHDILMTIIERGYNFAMNEYN